MDIVKLCLEFGASAAELIPVSRLELDPGLRELCAQNLCGRYGRNHTCPPLAGDIETLTAKIHSFKSAVIWQNIYPLEDSFDFEGMMEAQKKHNAMTLRVAQTVYGEYGRDNALVLAAGGCSYCETCAAVTDEPCRRPEMALSSLEAYGIMVAKIEDVSAMKYINGENTVTYFSGAFFS